MKSIFSKLEETKKIASETEKSILGYLLKNPEEAMELNIRQLANRTFSSPSTIIRMCKRVGFEGYKDFRQVMIYEMALRKQVKGQEAGEILKSDSLNEIISKVTYKNIDSLEKGIKLFDTEVLEKCVELIRDAKKICLYGIGASLCVARDAYLKFLRLNKYCTINDDWHSQLLQAKNMSEEDVGLVISYSGHTVEVIECMREMKKNGVPIIAITRNTPSLVAELSDYTIYVPSDEPILRSGAMSSRIAQLNAIDILYTAFANREYDNSQKVIQNNFIPKP